MVMFKNVCVGVAPARELFITPQTNKKERPARIYTNTESYFKPLFTIYISSE